MTAQLGREIIENLLQHNDESDSPANAEAWEVNALCRLALARMDCDTVAMQNFRCAMEGVGHIRRTLDETFGGLHGTHCEPDVLVECKAICDAICDAYRRTAPPAPVAVPDKKESISGSVFGEHYCDGWNACRAAMLQGDENSVPLTTLHPAPELDSSPKNDKSHSGSSPAAPDERAAFNAWNNEDNLPIAGVGAKNAAWLAWQARAAMLKAEPVTAATVPEKCWCRTCRPVDITDMRFVMCPDCGNKRCPKANDHRNACSGSNEPGQAGSAYPASPVVGDFRERSGMSTNRSREHFISLCNQFWNWQESDEINAGDEEPRLEWNGKEFTHRVTQALWRMYQAAPEQEV